jgi:multicomponent Na+:H+ antiporter subunit E
MTSPPPPRRSALRRAPVRAGRVVRFIVYYLWEFLTANAAVLHEILRPRRRGVPAIIALPLRCRRPVEIASLANLISLTPGTLTIEVALEPPTLYVHGMFASDPDRFIAGLRTMENHMLAAMRPVDAVPERG